MDREAGGCFHIGRNAGGRRSGSPAVTVDAAKSSLEKSAEKLVKKVVKKEKNQKKQLKKLFQYVEKTYGYARVAGLYR